jgi:hypothetical protein
MTVVTENARISPLDRKAREALARSLDRPEVIAVYLIGSQARGSAGPLSDVDVAALHLPGLTSRQRLDLRLDLAARAGEALGTSEVDVVLLNGAPPLIRQRALHDGILLVDRDPAQRIRFAVRTINDYVDTEPLRKLLSQRLRQSIAEDSFGRLG